MNDLENKEKDVSRKKKKMSHQKKMIIITFSCLIAFVVVYFLLALVDWESVFSSSKDKNNKDDIYFYDEALSDDLLADDKYNGMDQSINLRKESSGFTETITEKDLPSCGEAVSLLYNMLGYIKNGNQDAYNSCFSKLYYEKNPKQEKFTNQKIYNITIIEVESKDETDEYGNVYRQYYYKLDYMIRHNNGSLRDDMGSDCIKTQHVYLSDKTGEVLIDKLITLNYIE